MQSFLGIMRGHGQGKHMEGVWKVYPVDNPVTLPLGCDIVALLEVDILEVVIPAREDHSTLPFQWLMDNLVILPLGCDMLTFHKFNIPEREDHSTLPF